MTINGPRPRRNKPVGDTPTSPAQLRKRQQPGNPKPARFRYRDVRRGNRDFIHQLRTLPIERIVHQRVVRAIGGPIEVEVAVVPTGDAAGVGSVCQVEPGGPVVGSSLQCEAGSK